MELREKVRKVCDILVADWQRQGEYLDQSQVERLLDKRQLSPEECLVVFEHLARMGVVFDDAAVRARRHSLVRVSW